MSSFKMRRQSQIVFRTIAGSLVAGACGYYGAHIVVEIFCVPFFWVDFVPMFFCFCHLTETPFTSFFLSFSFSLAMMMMMMMMTTTTKSRERDQRLAELQEVSKSDGAVRERVLRAE
jgi:hypothetical protein